MLLQADRLLTVDMVDQADAIYRRVADQDPRNAIAVVGLARCALARGEDGEAYRLAARALEIDPENDMARRMTSRMAEVLAYRGTSPDAAAEATPVADAEPVAEAIAQVTPVAQVAATPATETAATPATRPVATGTAARPSTTPSRSWLDRIRGR